jgi:hypothetical protein
VETYWGVEVYLHAFLTVALDEGELPVSFPELFTPGVRAHGTHWIGGCVGLRASLDAVAKKKSPITIPAGNWVTVVHPVA